MKVVKKGAGQKVWAKECTCTGKGNGGGGCGAKLHVEQGDLFQTRFVEDYLDTPKRYITFECPECKVFTNIAAPFKAEDLPDDDVWKKRQKKRKKFNADEVIV